MIINPQCNGVDTSHVTVKPEVLAKGVTAHDAHGNLIVGTYETGESTMYSYNGCVLPPLPEYDREKYPYAVIDQIGYFIVMSEKGIYTPGIMMDEVSCPSPYMKTSIDTYGNFTEWKEYDTDATLMCPIYWSNHDVAQTDGTVYLSASDPVPVTLPIIIYDGEIEISQDPYYYNHIFGLKCGYRIGDTLEITFEGHTETYVATTADTIGGAFVGNLGLYGDGTRGVDDGGDFLLVFPQFIGGTWRFEICTRTAGTHTLKIVLLKAA